MSINVAVLALTESAQDVLLVAFCVVVVALTLAPFVWLFRASRRANRLLEQSDRELNARFVREWEARNPDRPPLP